MYKLFLSLESQIIFEERFKVTSVPSFIADFNLLRCELDHFHLNCYIESFCIDVILKKKKNTRLSQFLVKNLK